MKHITVTELKIGALGLVVFHVFSAVFHRLGHHGEPRTWTDVVVASIIVPLFFLCFCYISNNDLVKEDGR